MNSPDRVERKTIWIDMDNTPHVPFFKPIIRELERRDFRVILTSRDAFQVNDLANENGLVFKSIGRHYGKYMILKIMGWIWRAFQLAPYAIRNKPDLAISHGSRSQALIANLLRIPTVVIADFEHAKAPPLAHGKWKIMPEFISSEKRSNRRLLKYSGLKEDVYVSGFAPDRGILADLGLSELDFVVTIRPPATEAHYRNPQSDSLFSEVMAWVISNSDAKIVLLPRNMRQENHIRKHFKSWFAEKRVIIPDKAIDGLNLLFFSDLVISGGGTMNREGAALGIPVYSIFRGPLGDVDRHLESEGRLVMVASPEEMRTKIKLDKRKKCLSFKYEDRPALRNIISHIQAIIAQEAKGLKS